MNLRPLNRNVVYQHFKMEGVQFVRNFLQQEDWLARIDLKHAYFAMPIHLQFWKYLRFIWEETAYEFICLPFVLASAPRAADARSEISQGERNSLCFYLDDIMLMEQSR